MEPHTFPMTRGMSSSICDAMVTSVERYVDQLNCRGSQDAKRLENCC